MVEIVGYLEEFVIYIRLFGGDDIGPGIIERDSDGEGLYGSGAGCTVHAAIGIDEHAILEDLDGVFQDLVPGAPEIIQVPRAVSHLDIDRAAGADFLAAGIGPKTVSYTHLTLP